MKKSNPVLEQLSRSAFRRRFHLSQTEQRYLHEKGFETVEQHARQFIMQRLAPACISNDGRQTPMRNHPVFVAQHATATCCRKCLQKWHHIPLNVELTSEQVDYIVHLILDWLEQQNKQATFDS